MMQRATRPPMPVNKDNDERMKTNAKVLRKVRPSGDPAVDALAWEKSVKEFEVGSLVGPFDNIDDMPVSEVRLVQRFPLAEQHGESEPTVRNIDNCILQNVHAGTTAAHRPCDIDMWVVCPRIVGARFPEALLACTSDFKTAYRQVTACVRQMGQFAVAIWNPVREKVVYGLAVCQLFGSGSAPLNFPR